MLLDVFNNDAFSLFNLTAAIDLLPYQPGRIGELGLFEQKPTTTTVASIEERDGKLALVSTMPRGSSQQTTLSNPRRKLRTFQIPHLPLWNEILAAELEGKRAFGSDDQVEAFSQVVNDRMTDMKRDMELTWEWHRVGALHGKILDADGTSTVIDFFSEFGITQTTVTLDFSDPGTYALPDPVVDIKIFAQQIIRQMQVALGGTPFTGVHAICGNQFWDSFVSHGTVRKAYERYNDNQFLRETQIPGGTQPQGFKFADITWENYRGQLGTTSFFNTNEAIFFPEGTRGVFLEVPAPADFVETVNTRGQMLYAKQERMKWDKGVEVHVQSNVLYLCTRPACLIKVTGTNLAPENPYLVS